jgi:ribosomal protein S18 acetylase RimI-like enzyme
MNEIIRYYRPEDETAVSSITYRTGFKGEDLTGRGFFDDQRLFFLLSIYYYARFEPEHFFVIEKSGSGEVIGFICGTPDSTTQEKRFIRTMAWRILLRALFVTLWRYPRTFKTLLTILKMYRAIQEHDRQAFYEQYPAHLHINLLPGCQGLGLGTELMRRFEEHMIRQGAWGLNLSTTNYNRKAIPFYEKLGFILHRQIPFKHPNLADFQELIYVKGLKLGDS